MDYGVRISNILLPFCISNTLFRQRRTLKTREAIFKASTKLFVAKGHDSVSLRKIAKSSNVQPTIPGYHSGTKQNLWVEHSAKNPKFIRIIHTKILYNSERLVLIKDILDKIKESTRFFLTIAIYWSR